MIRMRIMPAVDVLRCFYKKVSLNNFYHTINQSRDRPLGHPSMNGLSDHVAHLILKRAIDAAIEDGDLAEAVCIACVDRDAYREFYEYVFRTFLERHPEFVVRFRVPRVVTHVKPLSSVQAIDVWTFDCALEVTVNRERANWTIVGLTQNVRCSLPTNADNPTYARNRWLRELLLLPPSSADGAYRAYRVCHASHDSRDSHDTRHSKHLARICWPGCAPESQAALPARFADMSRVRQFESLELWQNDMGPRRIDLTDALYLLRDVVHSARFDERHPPTPLKFPHLVAGGMHKGAYREWLSNEEIVQKQPLIFVPCFWVDVDAELCADLREALRTLSFSPANTQLNLQVFNEARRLLPSSRHALECFADARFVRTVRLTRIALINTNPIGSTPPVFDAESLEACSRIWFTRDERTTATEEETEEEEKELVLENVFLSDARVLDHASATHNLNTIRVTFKNWEIPDQLSNPALLARRMSTILQGMVQAYAGIPTRSSRSLHRRRTYTAEFRWIASRTHPAFAVELERVFDDAAAKFSNALRCSGRGGSEKTCSISRGLGDDMWAFTIGV